MIQSYFWKIIKQLYGFWFWFRSSTSTLIVTIQKIIMKYLQFSEDKIFFILQNFLKNSNRITSWIFQVDVIWESFSTNDNLASCYGLVWHLAFATHSCWNSVNCTFISIKYTNLLVVFKFIIEISIYCYYYPFIFNLK